MLRHSRFIYGILGVGLAAALFMYGSKGNDTTLADEVLLPITPPTATLIESRVHSIGLFKNGLAVVKRRIELPGQGVFEIADIPNPVHGTLWVESEALVEIRVTSRVVEIPLAQRAGGVNLEADLAGKSVTVHFRNGEIPMTQGRVLDRGTGSGEPRWNRSSLPPGNSFRGTWWGDQNSIFGSPRTGAVTDFLILETDRGQVFIDPTMIAFLQVTEDVTAVKRRKPVLQLTVPEMVTEGPITIEITYLAKGMAWAPSYRVDLSDSSVLTLRQKAVLRNELMDLDNVEIELISGFPSVEYSHVLSPLSPGTTWANFFQRLNDRTRWGGDITSNLLSQQVVLYGSSAAEMGIDLDAISAGSGVDLHYESVGRHSLLKGDALMLTTSEGIAEYERIVEWKLEDTRDEHGRRRVGSRQRNYGGVIEDENEAWDAIRFRNPLAFPMTTGPVIFFADGRFNGQQTIYWVNPGEEMTLRITKSLSVRTRAVEYVDDGGGEVCYIGHHGYRERTVDGELSMTNHRAEVVKMVIRRPYSGVLIMADGSPVDSVRADDAYLVNPARELTWTIELQPGERRVLMFAYSLLEQE